VSFLDVLGFGRERDAQGRRRRGAWMQTYSGGKIWPLDPRVDDVSFDDWVVGVARECRFGRQCRDWYSVAEHEVIVSLYVERLARWDYWPEHMVQLAAREALVHDHGEAIVGDMIRPLKHQRVMKPFRKVEKRLQQCAFDFFDVSPTHATTYLVKTVETRLLMDEIEQLMLDPQMFDERYEGIEGLGAEIAGLSWEQSIAAWCQRYCELWPEHEQALHGVAA
jgi:hypothetical protein